MEYTLRTEPALLAESRLDLDYLLQEEWQGKETPEGMICRSGRIRRFEDAIAIVFEGTAPENHRLKQVYAELQCATPAYELIELLARPHQHARVSGQHAPKITLHRNGKQIGNLYDFCFQTDEDGRGHSKFKFGMLPLNDANGEKIPEIREGLRACFAGQKGILYARGTWESDRGLLLEGYIREDDAEFARLEKGIELSKRERGQPQEQPFAILSRIRFRTAPVELFRNEL